MKVQDVPQDLKYYKDSLARDVCYAVDEEGRYTTVVSDGWSAKNDALELALEDKNAWRSEKREMRSEERCSESTMIQGSGTELHLEHRMAAHCENGATSVLLRFHGIDLSEPMIFGMASGLWFSHVPFIRLNGMPLTSFRTFPGVLFSRVTKQLGVKTRTCRFFSKESAMRLLDHVLMDKHKPVGCVVGMYDLPYVPPEYRFRFNGHNVCIIGKDETTESYSVLDSNITQKVTIHRDDLVKVRFAKGGTYPLMGQMYWIESVPEHLPDLAPLILKSISRTCRNMIGYSSIVPFLGTNGIHYMSRRIRTWESQMGRQKALLNLAQVIRMLEEIGTGGAGFRFIYGAFLQESAARTGIDELNDFSQRMTEIGDMWREFAYKGSRMIKRRKSERASFDDLGDLLEVIGNKEEKFFSDLYECIK